MRDYVEQVKELREGAEWAKKLCAHETAKRQSDAADAPCPLLLFFAERERRRWSHDRYWREMGRERKPSAQSRVSHSDWQKRHKRFRFIGFYINRAGGVVLTNDNEKSRRMVEQCYKRHKTTLNPIIEWTDRDVWDFIHAENIPYCELYNEGFHRLGCIGCPMATKHGRETEFARWPRYKMAYLKAFDRMLTERQRRGKLDGSWRMGTTAKDVMNWWMEYDILPGQMDLFEEETEVTNDA